MRLIKFLSFLLTAFITSTIFATDVRILETTGTSTIIEFVPANWHVKTRIIDGREYKQLEFEHSDCFSAPGEPMIVSRRVMIGIPPKVQISLRIRGQVAGQQMSGRLIPAPLVGDRWDYTEKPASYQKNTFIPADVVTVSKPMWYRDQRVVFVTFHPVQYYPAKNQIQMWRRLVAELEFIGQVPRKSSTSRHSFEYRNIILNHEQAAAWLVAPSQSTLHKSVFSRNGDAWYKLFVKDEGIYKLTGAYMAKNDIPIADIDPKTVKIFNNGGRELPRSLKTSRSVDLIENAITFVDGDGDNQLDESDYFLFYGKAVNGWAYDAASDSFSHYINHYTAENVYWLSWGGAPGLRMDTVRISDASGAIDRNTGWLRRYVEDELENPLASGIDWYGKAFTAGTTTSEKQTYTFDLPGAVEADSATVAIRILSASSGWHNFTYELNGQTIGSAGFPGISSRYVYMKENLFVKKTTGLLKNGVNQLRIRYQPYANFSRALLDWIEFHYKSTFTARDNSLTFWSPSTPAIYRYQLSGYNKTNVRVFDVTRFDQVRVLTSSAVEDGRLTVLDTVNSHHAKQYLAISEDRYLSPVQMEKVVPAGLREQHAPVDFIIITHDDFYEQALALKSFRESCDNLKTAVVKVSDIYNEFAWGMFDPVAIRDFVSFAYDAWSEPGYVLLLGSADYDYRNIFDPIDNNWVPTIQTTELYEGESRARDDFYVCIRGDDDLMDLAIGRLPVRTPDQAKVMVQKIIDYHNDPAPGDWRNSITMVADDVTGENEKIYEPEHTEDTETIIDYYIPNSFNINKLYLIDFPPVYTASITGVRKPAAQKAILDAINRGQLIINYVGHGRYDLWAHEVVLDMSTDMDRIRNGKKLALWVAATCYFGRFDNPAYEAMSEKLLVKPDGGSIAVFAATRLVQSNPNASLNRLLYEKLFPSAYAKVRLGDAIKNARNARGNLLNDQKTVLFADPTMVLANPAYKARITSITPDTIKALKRIIVSGMVLKDGVTWHDFNGQVLLQAADSRKNRRYEYTTNAAIKYWLPGNIIFRGVAPVTNGQFNIQFIVPKDITYGGDNGRISVFVWNDDQITGAGFRNGLVVGGTDQSLVDRHGPTIDLKLNDQPAFDGVVVDEKPTLTVELSDSISGINIAGAIGHNITLSLDGEKKVITDYFQYDTGSYTSGKIVMPMDMLSPGEHTLQIKAWDNSNNSSEVTAQVMVVPGSKLALVNVLNYPNPFTDETAFTFLTNQACDVTLKVYTVAGRLIYSVGHIQAEAGFNRITWDGTDVEGEPLANGVYLYKIIATGTSAEGPVSSEIVQKLMIVR